MMRRYIAMLLFGLALALPVFPVQARTLDITSNTSQHDARPHTQRQAELAPTRSLASKYRSCRRQVRYATGIVPGKRMRLPRSYHQLIDRCVANGGVYT